MPTPPNKLLLPLIAVSVLCVIEALTIAFLLGRTSSPSPAAQTTNSQTADKSEPPAKAPTSPPITRGKVGQRIDAAGVAMTITALSNEPRFKEVFTPPPSQKFLDVEVLFENTSAPSFKYYPTEFSLKDSNARAYSATQLGAGDPPLTSGTLVPGEKIRGHLAFVLPRDATGLTLSYPPTDNHVIQVDLGQ